MAPHMLLTIRRVPMLMTDTVVIFGDPLNGTAVGTVNPSKVLVICHAQDLICKGTWIVDSEHLDVSTPMRLRKHRQT